MNGEPHIFHFPDHTPSTWSGETIKFTGPVTPPSLHFVGGVNAETMLTLSSDGKLIVGAGLSEDEATSRVAAMLAAHYGRLHQEQAEEISRLKAELAAARPGNNAP